MSEEPYYLDDSGPRLARPYAVTRGRTESAVDLPLEAMIETCRDVGFDAFHVAHARIVALCHTPLSVAEIAAELDLALGVARVLIGDLLVEGILRRHQTITADASREQWMHLLERTLQGLRAL
ncbi:DUF742 domain-containing protein [Nocardia farcinica]|uniref:DUF742 domain-containing protein n=1 Tax=Nocardia farcinica TaxID=37329 RepID=UPI0018961AE1|nr:DUF742 domain-containing protein [Nocardia farcinica]MBF6072595.1 DUF742 domain-containing protein [Nocardia farcinica]